MFLNLLYKNLDFFWGKFFEKLKNGQKKCPKIKT